MKIVSFTMVNNESEIIESFVRYNYNFVDEMVIIDNGCTDNTIKILQNLISEGYKITIYDESLQAYDQFRLDNKYLNKIIEESNPDIILPLDADEFLTGQNNPRIILENLDLDYIYYVHWRWYVMTENDDENEAFIPKRLNYCLRNPATNLSDGTLVTKTIIPTKYYKNLNLTLSMGHHTVFGNENVKIKELDSLQFAHYRAISEIQFISKTMCYTMRDIATMGNNIETAQRTNQMALIESGQSMRETVIESSFGGYAHDIVFKPLNLSYCTKVRLDIRYANLSNESLAKRVLNTGREMAIRAYNSERKKKEKAFIDPIVVWMDGIRGEDYTFPDPSNEITFMASEYNVRGYLTTSMPIRFLKVNYRLIVTPDIIKFLPHKYIVIPNTVDFEKVKQQLVQAGINQDIIISLKEYRKKLGLIRNVYCKLRFVPSICQRVFAYVRRNGTRTTISKIMVRIHR